FPKSAIRNPQSAIGRSAIINAFARVNFYAFAPVGIDPNTIRLDPGRDALRYSLESPVKSKAWGDQIKQRRSVGDGDVFEQSTHFELVPHAPLFDSQPVICPLQGQLRVFSRLDFDHSQASFIIYCQKVDDRPLIGMPGRDLRIDETLIERGVEPANV